MLNDIKKISLKVTQNKFYLITILLLLFISFQLDGINDKLKIIIEIGKNFNL
tara:strand:+ start:464 stop:619 length:156 start_codon:yes stop_codon:yes gene_type:complete